LDELSTKVSVVDDISEEQFKTNDDVKIIQSDLLKQKVLILILAQN
jgi:hypothetical protein